MLSGRPPGPSRTRTIRRSGTSEPPGPSRAEAIRASRRARLEPKRYERAVGQAAGPVSNPNHPPKRYERAVGQAAGPVSKPNHPPKR
jgi:hypothetical protein